MVCNLHRCLLPGPDRPAQVTGEQRRPRDQKPRGSSTHRTQAHRFTGSQAHRFTGAQVHRRTGSQAHRRTGLATTVLIDRVTTGTQGHSDRPRRRLASGALPRPGEDDRERCAGGGLFSFVSLTPDPSPAPWRGERGDSPQACSSGAVGAPLSTELERGRG
ncbi:MAG: hypothetical protein EOO74_03420 [Myxococcales bacterium]|nr:MAG: hypothetical protein EOO74_03420 [Myxococcales bacterium]